MLIASQVLLTLLMIYIAMTTLYNLRTMIRLPGPNLAIASQPLVSVLIPARNEAEHIGTALGSVLRQDYARLEILVLDDDSSDGTAQVVERCAGGDTRVRLLRGAPLPEEWQGKSWACHQLYQQAAGDWLLFLDADTHLRADAISSAITAASHHKLDLLSLLPDMQLRTFGVRIIMALVPFVLVSWVSHDAFTQDPSPVLAIAYGPFMLLSRSGYERAGGHAAIKSDIVDDVGLARAVKRSGGRIALADGVDVLQIASYPDFSTAWHSVTKSLYPVFTYNPVYLTLTVLAVAAIYITPYLLLFNALWLATYTLASFWLPLIQVLLAASVMGLIGRRHLIPPWYAPLYLLTILAGIGFCIDSMLSNLLGPGTVWKDRIYRFGSK